MSADLKFYTEDALELPEIDAGQVRMNHGTIVPIKIKNEGTDRAKDVSIGSGTLKSLSQLKEELKNDILAEAEYDKQLMASKWKSFSLEKDGVYQESLDLGNITAGKFLEGTQTIKESFSNKDKCILKDVWSYCLEDFGNSAIKIYKNEANSQTAQRKDIDIGDKRDVQIMFKMDYQYDSSAYAKSNCLVIFPVRINDKGLGYVLSFQFRASDGKVYFGVYKDGKGMVSNLSRTYGTRIIDSNAFLSFDASKQMGARIFTDQDGNTCFQFFLNNTMQRLYLTSDRTTFGTTVIDPKNSYPNAGKAYFDVGLYRGDLSVKLSNLNITTETEQQTIYVKSIIDSSATNNEKYDSAISLNYIEE